MSLEQDQIRQLATPAFFEDYTTLENGRLAIRWPSEISADEFRDVAYFVEGWLRKVKRWSEAKPPFEQPETRTP